MAERAVDPRSDSARAAAEAVARQSYGKLVAVLAKRTGNVAAAEDALGDAFATALAEWPAGGVPDNPEGWLVTVARRRLIDRGRRQQTADAATGALTLLAEELEDTATAAMEIPDERLALMFACAHPAIDADIRAPLILQTILGLNASDIASAFLLAPATMGQRLVRAKTKIAEAGIPFRVPERTELGGRLDAVLDAIYATFSEGWTDATGSDTRRRNLAEEGIWLGRLMVSLMPDEPEGLGLLALMLYADSRRGARRSEAGDYVPLGDQDTHLWDDAEIDEAEALLRQASAGGATGRYQIEAAIQSAHAVRRLTGRADLTAIAALYAILESMTGSPVVAINRAAVIGEIDGPPAGLAALDRLAGDARLEAYQPYWAARADLKARIGDARGAAEAYERAIGLETDPAVRRFLIGRKNALPSPTVN